MIHESNFRRTGRWTISVGILVAMLPTNARAVQDVMLQTMEGTIVTGSVNDLSGEGTVGARVFRGFFFPTSFITSDPGFFGLPTGSPGLEPGVAGFPSEHDIEFDLLPMRVGSLKSNLFYWNGADLNGNGPDETDLAFVNSPGVSWKIVDGDEPFSNTFLVPGTDELISGGLIDRSAMDQNPSDGIDTGRVHAHLALQLFADGAPPQGVYMIAWQARSEGFETSEPFLFVHRTSGISDEVRDAAASWAEENIDTMFGPELPGDYNEDGVVDAGDYVYWRNRLGMEIELPNEDDSLGVVDLADYAVWKMHYGEFIGNGGGAGGLALTVPEPAVTSVALFVTALIVAKSRRRKREQAER